MAISRSPRVQPPIAAGATGLAALALAAFDTAPRAYAHEFCVSCAHPAGQYVCQTQFGQSKIALAAARLLCIQKIARQYGHQRCSAGQSEKQARCLGRIVVVSPDDLARNLPPALAGRPDHLPSSGSTIGHQEAESLQTRGEQEGGPANGREGARGVQAGAVPGQRVGGEGAPTIIERDGGATAAPRPATQTDSPDQSAAGQSAADGENGPPKTVEELAKRATESSKKSLEKAGDSIGGAVEKTWKCLSSFLSDC